MKWVNEWFIYNYYYLYKCQSTVFVVGACSGQVVVVDQKGCITSGAPPIYLSMFVLYKNRIEKLLLIRSLGWFANCGRRHTTRWWTPYWAAREGISFSRWYYLVAVCNFAAENYVLMLRTRNHRHKREIIRHRHCLCARLLILSRWDDGWLAC